MMMTQTEHVLVHNFTYEYKMCNNQNSCFKQISACTL